MLQYRTILLRLKETFPRVLNMEHLNLGSRCDFSGSRTKPECPSLNCQLVVHGSGLGSLGQTGGLIGDYSVRRESPRFSQRVEKLLQMSGRIRDPSGALSSVCGIVEFHHFEDFAKRSPFDLRANR